VPTNILPDNRCHRKYAIGRKLKVATWNANGLANHSQAVKAFMLSQDIDILLVSETQFTNKSSVSQGTLCITQCILIVQRKSTITKRRPRHSPASLQDHGASPT